MEALDRAIARNASRLDPNKVLKPAEVRTLDDVRRLVAELDPGRNKEHKSVPISTIMNVVEDKSQVSYLVSANTKSKSKRDIILEAFEAIKRRIMSLEKMVNSRESVEINGRGMKPASFINNIDSVNWVDKLLTQWLGAYRDGLMICWKLSDGCVYKYDIFSHKLTRTSNAI